MCSRKTNSNPETVPPPMAKTCYGLQTVGAAHRGMGGMVYCLSNQRVVCEHVVHFGDSHYCLHPQNPDLTGRFAAFPQENSRQGK